MQFDQMRGLIKPVETVQNFLSRLSERTGMFGCLDGVESIRMAEQQMQEWLLNGDISLRSISKRQSTTTFVVNSEMEHMGGDDGSRLIRDEESVGRCTVPVGTHGSFEVSEAASAAINHLRTTAYRPSEVILKAADMAVELDLLNKKDHPTECLAVREFKKFGTGKYYQAYFCDSAWRLYAWTLGIASHQQGDFHRGLCRFDQHFDHTREDIDFLEMRVKEDYGVGYHNYTKILNAGLNGDLIRNPSKYGIKEKKKWRALDAAAALEEVIRTGRTNYILQLDHTCSGFQLWGMLTGCTNSLSLTNVMPEPGGAVNDLYTAVYEIASDLNIPASLLNYVAHFYNRPSSKELTVPIGYGASAPTAARSLKFKKGKGQDVEYVDAAGMYIPGSLERVNKDEFNQRNLAIWQEMGWEKAVDASMELSQAYTTSIFTISKPLQSGMQIVKESVKRANDLNNGRGIFEFTNVMGCTYRCAKVRPDFSALEDKSRMVTLNRFKLNGKRVGGWKMMPNIIDRSEAAGPPRVIHLLDSGCIMYVAIRLAQHGIPYAPIHDSHGIPACFWRLLVQFVGEYFFEKMDNNVLLQFKEKYGMTGHGHFTPFDQTKGNPARLVGMTPIGV